MRKRFDMDSRWLLQLSAALLLTVQVQTASGENSGTSNAQGALECAQWRKLNNTAPAKLDVAPTYPDIWSLVPSMAQNERLTRMVLLPDGDVGLSFYKREDNSTRYQRMFFDRPLSEEERCRIQHNVGKPSLNAKLVNGHVVRNLGHGGVLSNGCYAGLSDTLAVFSDEGLKHVLIRKTFLYVLDKPRHWIPKPNCYEGDPFDYRVISLGRWQLLPLPDGTFVAAQMYGDSAGVESFVLRLDEQLKIKSTLLNDKLFYFPEGFDLSAYGEEGGKHDPLGMQRDLYQRLMDVRLGKK